MLILLVPTLTLAAQLSPTSRDLTPLDILAALLRGLGFVSGALQALTWRACNTHGL